MVVTGKEPHLERSIYLRRSPLSVLVGLRSWANHGVRLDNIFGPILNDEPAMLQRTTGLRAGRAFQGVQGIGNTLNVLELTAQLDDAALVLVRARAVRLRHAVR
jgi:hypothetical protein